MEASGICLTLNILAYANICTRCGCSAYMLYWVGSDARGLKLVPAGPVRLRRARSEELRDVDAPAKAQPCLNKARESVRTRAAN